MKGVTMKAFQKRSVAALVLVAAIVAGIFIGQAKKPDPSVKGATNLKGSYNYTIDKMDVISEKTRAHIDAINTSLFAQTGAQIVVEVVNTTGNDSIAEFAQSVFDTRGIGSKERNNGILLLLALKNNYNGTASGDYYIGWGSGFSSSEGDALDSIMKQNLESDFAAGNYDAGVRKTFDKLVSYLADGYGVTVKENYVPAVSSNYQVIGGSYGTYNTGYVEPAAMTLVCRLLVMLGVLLALWIALDAVRWNRYRKRYMRPGMERPTVWYYPVFWGRSWWRPGVPYWPYMPMSRGGVHRRGVDVFGGDHENDTFGGGRGHGGFGGGSFGGGAGRGGFGGGSFGGGAGRGVVSAAVPSGAAQAGAAVDKSFDSKSTASAVLLSFIYH
jgi:uncharacterized protein